MAAVEAAMVIATEQGAVADRRSETLDDPALDGDDGLQVDTRTLAAALDAAEHGRQAFADAIDDIALGIGGHCFVQCNPAPGLAGEVQSENSMHDLDPNDRAKATAKPIRVQCGSMGRMASELVLLFEILHRQGPVEKIPLQHIAAHLRQALGDLQGLDTFRHDPHGEIVRQVDHRLDDGVILF